MTPQRFVALFAAGLSLAVTTSSAAAQLPPSVRDIEVRVVDQQGGPIQDVRVRICGFVPKSDRFALLPGQEWRTLQAKDFASNHARLTDLPDGQLVLFVEADNHALTVSKQFELPAKSTVKLTVRLQAGITLTGTVTTPDGKPVADATVRTADREAENQNLFVRALGDLHVGPLTRTTVRTAADGTFRIANVAAGDYVLYATHADWAELRHPVKVKGKAEKDVGKLPLLAGGAVTGAVQRAGKRVADAIVVLESKAITGKGPLAYPTIRHEVRSDAQGNFTLPRVPFGSYQIFAHEGGSPMEQAQAIGASRHAIEVKPQPDGTAQPDLVLLPKL